MTFTDGTKGLYVLDEKPVESLTEVYCSEYIKMLQDGFYAFQGVENDA